MGICLSPWNLLCKCLNPNVPRPTNLLLSVGLVVQTWWVPAIICNNTVIWSCSVCAIWQPWQRALWLHWPRAIIWGCHLIPDFNTGRTHELMPASVFQDEGSNWKQFCIAQWVDLNFISPYLSLMDSCFSLSDCNLMMRFTGLGVSHLEYKAPLSTNLWLRMNQTG